MVDEALRYPGSKAAKLYDSVSWNEHPEYGWAAVLELDTGQPGMAKIGFWRGFNDDYVVPVAALRLMRRVGKNELR